MMHMKKKIHSHIKDNLIIGKSAKLESDVTVSQVFKKGEGPTIINDNCLVGANSVLYSGVEIGQGATVKPGSLVDCDVPPHAIYTGNPGQIIGYNINSDYSEGVIEHKLNYIKNSSGVISICTTGEDAPFEFKRTFTLFEIEKNATRGNHAHYECHQFLTCHNGYVDLFCDDGKNRSIIRLNNLSNSVHILPGTWISLFNFQKKSVVNVHTSHTYDEADYIRDYKTYINYKNSKKFQIVKD